MVRSANPQRFAFVSADRKSDQEGVMRKPTEPQTRKPIPASSRKQLGLIATDHRRKQSAQPTSVLDNRSHRTFGGSRRRESTAQPGEAVSGAYPERVPQHSRRRQAARQRGAA
jgi:hypothetical protein